MNSRAASLLEQGTFILLVHASTPLEPSHLHVCLFFLSCHVRV